MTEWRRSFAKRGRVEWISRGALATLVAITAYAGIAQTIAYTARTVDIDRAYALAPNDGRITALKAQALLGTSQSPATLARINALGREALQRDPTAVVAAATLGLTAQLAGKVGEARRLLLYAQKLSRRDLPTQLWAIEDAVGRGDVRGALYHYDVALRTSRNAPEMLFPILSSAISDPDIRGALTKTLVARPAWGMAFLDYVADHGSDQRATASLFMTLARAGVFVSPGAQAAIVDTLMAKGEIDAAWLYHASIRSGADRRRSRDPGFTAAIEIPTPFDWMIVDNAGISSSIQQDSDGGTYEFSAPPSVGGPLLRQRQVLPPGTYRLTGHSIGIDQPADSRPYWALICQDGRELGRVEVPNSSQANGAFAGQFTVPAECRAQTLALIARPSDLTTGLAGQINRVLLAR